ncbi:hypothetical protein L3Q82_005999 [Scortum barcoo]|uniref:Uncharacterized protein n=1 Tax=Scortum barcoo TaxID=214431 RepID=A0ACB8X276_9TELE|nr:hypothetical protein L3Q82_005999 [Scortum barcoo]
MILLHNLDSSTSADTFSSRQVFVLLSVTVGGYIFGSGTKLFVTDEQVVKPVVSVYPAASRAHLEGKSSLLCVASAMFPPLVQFSWKRQKEDGPLEELPPAEGEQLELSESGCTGTIRVIDQDAINKYKYRCYVRPARGGQRGGHRRTRGFSASITITSTITFNITSTIISTVTSTNTSSIMSTITSTTMSCSSVLPVSVQGEAALPAAVLSADSEESAASERHFSPGSPEETPLHKMLFLPAAALCCLCSALVAMAAELIQEDLTLTRRVGQKVSFSCGTDQCSGSYVYWYQKERHRNIHKDS